jgi:hypothetical protein
MLLEHSLSSHLQQCSYVLDGHLAPPRLIGDDGTEGNTTLTGYRTAAVLETRYDGEINKGLGGPDESQRRLDDFNVDGSNEGDDGELWESTTESYASHEPWVGHLQQLDISAVLPHLTELPSLDPGSPVHQAACPRHTHELSGGERCDAEGDGWDGGSGHVAEMQCDMQHITLAGTMALLKYDKKHLLWKMRSDAACLALLFPHDQGEALEANDDGTEIQDLEMQQTSSLQTCTKQVASSVWEEEREEGRCHGLSRAKAYKQDEKEEDRCHLLSRNRISQQCKASVGEDDALGWRVEKAGHSAVSM